MGEYTTNDWFYKPAYGAQGQSEKDDFDAALDAVDEELEDHKSQLEKLDTRKLSDVQDTPPSDGDILQWDKSENRYKPTGVSTSNGVPTVRTIADLRDRDVSVDDNDVIFVTGYYISGDEGSSWRYADTSSSKSDDDGWVIVDANNTRWKLMTTTQEFRLEQFGGGPSESASVNTSAFETFFDNNLDLEHITLLLPRDTIEVDDTIRPCSNSTIRGHSMGKSTIKMKDDVDRAYSVIVTGDISYPRENISMFDFTVDFNESRKDNDEGSVSYEEDSNQSCVVMSSTDGGTVQRIKAINAYKHGINISGSDNMRGDNDDESYSDYPSRNILVDDCYVSDFGDDGITTHQSAEITISNCFANDATADYVGNSNGFEIDDGSRHIFLSNCTAHRCNAGLEIKGHDDTPAPYNVNVDGFIAVNNAMGVSLRHLGHHDDDEPDSTTAYNVNLNNITIIGPRKEKSDFSSDIRALEIKAYSMVNISNITITDGTKDTDAEDADSNDIDAVVWFMLKARFISVNNLSMYGFDGAEHGIYVTSSSHWYMTFNNIKMLDVGAKSECFYVTDGVEHVKVDNFLIVHADNPYSDTYGLQLAGGLTDNDNSAGGGHVDGYDNNDYDHHWG